jgi:hypothetical protein
MFAKSWCVVFVIALAARLPAPVITGLCQLPLHQCGQRRHPRRLIGGTVQMTFSFSDAKRLNTETRARKANESSLMFIFPVYPISNHDPW